MATDWRRGGKLTGKLGLAETRAIAEGADMTMGTERGPSTTTRVLEKGLRRLLEHPYLFPLLGLGFALLVALPAHRNSLRTELEILGWTALFIAWLPFWVARRPKDPSGRSWLTIILAIVGALLSGRLVAFDLAFAIVSLTLMAQYFTLLSFPVALLCGLPAAIGSEYSHRLAVLAEPGAFPWSLALLRVVAFTAIGISFKVLAMEMEERARLQANLKSAERKAGRLEERQRLAREIHDTLAQGFASIIVHFERAEQIDSLAASPAKPHLDLARSVAREGLEEARRMLAALRPEILEQRGLPDAMGRVCEEWSRRTGIQANLSITGTPAPMHPQIELTLLRGTQEALTNVARHSGARMASVTLSYMEDVLVLDVQDDGKGFVPPSDRSPSTGAGFGLTGMRERAERLQGTFSVESVPDEGTTVSISLPVLLPTGADTLTGGLL
jgi:signal transduction histidine kinase